MNQRSKVAFFRRTPWLAGVGRADVDQLVSATEVLQVERGQSIWRPEDRADRVYWVRTGFARVERSESTERTLILRFHGRGDVFGVAALYSNRARDTANIAHSDCALFATPVEVVEDLARRNGQMGLRLSELLIERQRRLEERLAGLVFQTVRERLLAQLAELAKDFGIRDSRGVIVDLRLTHRELAALVGATRETVSLTLVGLRKDGWISTEDRRIVLLKAASSQLLPRAPRGRV